MKKETFLYGYGPLSAIKYSIERFSAQHRRRNSSRRRKISFSEQREFHAVGEGVVCYNRRDVMDWALEEKEEKVIQGICYAAAGEERFDILVEVWGNFEDDYRRGIFVDVDLSAARHGKLNVLKWFETKGISIDEDGCALQAAEYGHIDILEWLQDSKGLELFEELYIYAMLDDNLNVLKWLREQGCPWDDWTFHIAAKKDNLDVLQWLHDEGCPWPEDYRIREVYPEVFDWLRVNGYGDRIEFED